MQSIEPPEPRVFRYSLDWRFLLPVADPAQIRVVFEEEAGFCEALDRVGIPFAEDSREEEKGRPHSLVFPFGLPLRRISSQSERQIEFYRSIRQRIAPGGHFLLGFRNSRLARPDSQYHASTPPRVTDQLSRAGFCSIKLFGAMPNLLVPEYIFELNPQAMNFTLQHRFRRKPVLLDMLHVLKRTVGWNTISNFLPCYFALAMA
ncbi:MAG TPA: hypothetical protein VHP14_02180 [Anaerolineales bacterium]|nr:hypothetical protein [Anaerolineales bacterium]